MLASSDGISAWTTLKPQHSNPNPNPLANQLWCIDFPTPPTPLIILSWTSNVAYSYANTCRNIFNTIKTSGHSSLEKIYLSLYWKGFVWEGVGDRTKTATYWPPHFSGYHSFSFPFSWAAQLGAWEPILCWDMVLIPASSLPLIWTSCRRGYIIIWHPPTFCERHNSHSVQPPDSQGCPLISSTGCTCYLHRCISFFWQHGRGQYATLMPLKNWWSIHARWSKSSLKHSIRFCGIFSKFKTEFYSISFF